MKMVIVGLDEFECDVTVFRHWIDDYHWNDGQDSGNHPGMGELVSYFQFDG